jgi:hypothetical protein
MTIILDEIKLKRGASTDVAAASLARGEPAVALDNKELWVGDGTGKVKITDTNFYNSFANFPSTGASNKLYIAKDSAAAYIWDPVGLEYKKYELSGQAAMVHCRVRTSTTTTFPTSYQDLTYPIKDAETEPTKLSHDGTNQDRIIFHEAGYYRVAYNITYEIPPVGGTRSDVNNTVQSRINKNDTTFIPASESDNIHKLYYVNEGLTDELANEVVEYFTANEWISTQIMSSGDSAYVVKSSLEVYKVDSIKGDVGTPGTPGSIWYNGSGIPILSLGDDNDYYHNNDNSDVYYKQSGNWSLISNLKGEVGDPGTAIPLPIVQARRTTEYSVPNGSWGDISFDTTDVENDDSIIEHDNTNRDRILIKENGYYMISYHGDIDDEGMMRVRKNDTTVLPGSERDYGNHADAVDLEGPLANVFFASLNVGDFLTAQIQAASTAEILRVNPIFTVVKMQGPKGEKGETGDVGPAGEAFKIDEYSNIDETKITSIETGSGASPTDLYYLLVLDDNRSNQTLPSSLNGDMSKHVIMFDGSNWYDFGPFTGMEGPQGPAGNDGQDGSGLEEQHYTESESEQQTTNDSYDEKLKLTTSALSGGTYRIQWYYEWRYSTGVRNFKARVQVDDTTIIAEQSQEPKDSGSDIYHCQSGFKRIVLSSGVHTVDLDWCCETLGDTATIRRARIELWKTGS